MIPKIIIRVLSGERVDQTLELSAESGILGRNPEHPLCIPDASVSRAHARFLYRDGHYLIEDLRSTGGTLLDGAPVTDTPLPLHEQGQLRAGAVEMQYCIVWPRNADLFAQQTFIKKPVLPPLEPIRAIEQGAAPPTMIRALGSPSEVREAPPTMIRPRPPREPAPTPPVAAPRPAVESSRREDDAALRLLALSAALLSLKDRSEELQRQNEALQRELAELRRGAAAPPAPRRDADAVELPKMIDQVLLVSNELADFLEEALDALKQGGAGPERARERLGRASFRLGELRYAAESRRKP